MEIHRIKQDSPYYGMLEEYCTASKELYNAALHLLRQFYLYTRNTAVGLPVDDLEVPQAALDMMSAKETHKNDLTYYDLDKLAKLLFLDKYRAMPTAVSAQRTLRAVSIAMDNYKAAIRTYNKEKVAGNEKPKTPKPQMPKPRWKYGMYPVTLTGQSCRVGSGRLTFPKAFKGLELETKQTKICFVRFVPRGVFFQVDVCYEVEEKPKKEDNRRYMAIDIGVNNLAAVTSNFNGTQYLINGRPLKALTKYYDDLIFHYRTQLKKVNKKYRNQDADSKRIESLWKNRNDKVNSYLHKASKKLVDLAEDNEVSKIIVGYNEADKDQIWTGTQNPSFRQFREMLIYKGHQRGIEVIEADESYTSGTSYLDGEEPVKANYDISRRITRGTFRANDGRLLNSDCNASYQILRKVDPDFHVVPERIEPIKIL